MNASFKCRRSSLKETIVTPSSRTERNSKFVSLEFQSVFVNILNHNQWLDPGQPWGLFSPNTFGALFGSAQENLGGDRSLQLGARVRF